MTNHCEHCCCNSEGCFDCMCNECKSTTQNTIEFRSVGIEIEVADFDNSHRKWKRSFAGGKSVSDGSIRGNHPREWVSPILTTKNDLGEWLSRVGGVAKGEKVRVNESCGLHVHVDSSNRTAPLGKILKEWRKVEDFLFSISGNRQENGYCCPVQEYLCWANDDLEVRSLLDADSYGRYYALNIQSDIKHGTFEIRMAKATLDIEFIYGWALVCQTILSHLMDGETVEGTPEEWILSILDFDEKEWMKDILIGEKPSIDIPRIPLSQRPMQSYNFEEEVSREVVMSDEDEDFYRNHNPVAYQGVTPISCGTGFFGGYF